MKRLSKEHILMLHSQLIDLTGGCDGVRDFYSLMVAFERGDNNGGFKF